VTAPIARLGCPLLGEVFACQATGVRNSAKIDQVAKLFGGFQSPNYFGRPNERNVSMQAAATLKSSHAVAVQLIGSLVFGNAFPDIGN
jgi:hypothetical protein